VHAAFKGVLATARDIVQPTSTRGNGNDAVAPSSCTRPFLCMLASISAAALTGAVGRRVSVEVHVSNGLPGFTIVGLPDAAVRESRDRVRAALLSSGLPWPVRRVTVNLAPSSTLFGR
jgi:hypothetical protein